MTNKEKAEKVFGFDPFQLRYTENPVDYLGVTGTMQYGPIWLVRIGEKYYNFSEWLRCRFGKVPEHEYYLDGPANWWRLREGEK